MGQGAQEFQRIMPRCDDTTLAGKLLRYTQQYVSASATQISIRDLTRLW